MAHTSVQLAKMVLGLGLVKVQVAREQPALSPPWPPEVLASSGALAAAATIRHAKPLITPRVGFVTLRRGAWLRRASAPEGSHAERHRARRAGR